MHTLRRILVATSLVLGLLVATPALGEPLMQQNLLRNGGFEENSTAGWTEFQNPPPANAEGCYDDYWLGVYMTSTPSRVHSGGRAVSYTIHWRTFQAGFYQQADVTSGATYRASAWGHMWSTDDPETTTSAFPVQMRVGIDPTGGTDWTSSNIQWSPMADARDTYREMSVEATATANRVTVFLYAHPTYCVYQSDAYWDDASLVEVTAAPSGGTSGEGQTPAATQAPAGTWGVAAGSIPCATPRPDGSVVHTVGQGETLYGIFNQYTAYCGYDVSYDSILQLNDIANPRNIYPGQEIIIVPAGGAVPPQPTEEPPAEGAGGEGEAPAEGEGGAEAADTTQPVEPSEPAAPESAEGTICVLAYEDANGDGLRDPATEQLAAGVTFTITDGAQQIVANFVTDGFTEQSCYNLTPGTYIVRWASDTHQATTDQMWTAGVTGGGLASREFGVQTIGEQAETGGGGGRGLTTALIAAGGVVLLMIGIGAAVYFFVLRRPASDF
jgi:hypothetical protein